MLKTKSKSDRATTPSEDSRANGCAEASQLCVNSVQETPNVTSSAPQVDDSPTSSASVNITPETSTPISGILYIVMYCYGLLVRLGSSLFERCFRTQGDQRSNEEANELNTEDDANPSTSQSQNNSVSVTSCTDAPSEDQRSLVPFIEPPRVSLAAHRDSIMLTFSSQRQHRVELQLAFPVAGLCGISDRLCALFRPDCIVEVKCSQRTLKKIAKYMTELGLPTLTRIPSVRAVMVPQSPIMPCARISEVVEEVQTCMVVSTCNNIKMPALIPAQMFYEDQVSYPVSLSAVKSSKPDDSEHACSLVASLSRHDETSNKKIATPEPVLSPEQPSIVEAVPMPSQNACDAPVVQAAVKTQEQPPVVEVVNVQQSAPSVSKPPPLQIAAVVDDLTAATCDVVPGTVKRVLSKRPHIRSKLLKRHLKRRILSSSSEDTLLKCRVKVSSPAKHQRARHVDTIPAPAGVQEAEHFSVMSIPPTDDSQNSKVDRLLKRLDEFRNPVDLDPKLCRMIERMEQFRNAEFSDQEKKPVVQTEDTEPVPSAVAVYVAEHIDVESVLPVAADTPSTIDPTEFTMEKEHLLVIPSVPAGTIDLKESTMKKERILVTPSVPDTASIIDRKESTMVNQQQMVTPSIQASTSPCVESEPTIVNQQQTANPFLPSQGLTGCTLPPMGSQPTMIKQQQTANPFLTAPVSIFHPATSEPSQFLSHLQNISHNLSDVEMVDSKEYLMEIDSNEITITRMECDKTLFDLVIPGHIPFFQGNSQKLLFSANPQQSSGFGRSSFAFANPFSNGMTSAPNLEQTPVLGGSKPTSLCFGKPEQITPGFGRNSTFGNPISHAMRSLLQKNFPRLTFCENPQQASAVVGTSCTFANLSGSGMTGQSSVFADNNKKLIFTENTETAPAVVGSSFTFANPSGSEMTTLLQPEQSSVFAVNNQKPETASAVVGTNFTFVNPLSSEVKAQLTPGQTSVFGENNQRLTFSGKTSIVAGPRFTFAIPPSSEIGSTETVSSSSQQTERDGDESCCSSSSSESSLDTQDSHVIAHVTDSSSVTKETSLLDRLLDTPWPKPDVNKWLSDSKIAVIDSEKEETSEKKEPSNLDTFDLDDVDEEAQNRECYNMALRYIEALGIHATSKHPLAPIVHQGKENVMHDQASQVRADAMLPDSHIQTTSPTNSKKNQALRGQVLAVSKTTSPANSKKNQALRGQVLAVSKTTSPTDSKKNQALRGQVLAVSKTTSPTDSKKNQALRGQVLAVSKTTSPTDSKNNKAKRPKPSGSEKNLCAAKMPRKLLTKTTPLSPIPDTKPTTILNVVSDGEVPLKKNPNVSVAKEHNQPAPVPDTKPSTGLDLVSSTDVPLEELKKPSKPAPLIYPKARKPKKPVCSSKRLCFGVTGHEFDVDHDEPHCRSPALVHPAAVVVSSRKRCFEESETEFPREPKRLGDSEDKVSGATCDQLDPGLPGTKSVPVKGILKNDKAGLETPKPSTDREDKKELVSQVVEKKENTPRKRRAWSQVKPKTADTSVRPSVDARTIIQAMRLKKKMANLI